MTETVLLTPENDAPKVEKVWMFISRDEKGQENVLGATIGDMGLQPLITGNEKVMLMFRSLATLIVQEMKKKEGDKRTVHLLEFSTRREVEGWMVQ